MHSYQERSSVSRSTIVSNTTIGLTCEVSHTEIQLLAATARTEHRFEADTGFSRSLRNEMGLNAWGKTGLSCVFTLLWQQLPSSLLTVTSITLSCPTKDVIASHCLRFRMPATNTPLLTLFGTARNVPSGDQLQMQGMSALGGYVHLSERSVPKSPEPTSIRGVYEGFFDLCNHGPICRFPDAN